MPAIATISPASRLLHVYAIQTVKQHYRGQLLLFYLAGARDMRDTIAFFLSVPEYSRPMAIFPL